MNEIITKKELEQSLQFFSELDIKEEDYANILETFGTFFKNNENKQILEKIITTIKFDDEKDLKAIMETIINSKEIPNLNILLQRMIKHEHLINEIQDYFIEKII